MIKYKLPVLQHTKHTARAMMCKTATTSTSRNVCPDVARHAIDVANVSMFIGKHRYGTAMHSRAGSESPPYAARTRVRQRRLASQSLECQHVKIDLFLWF